MIGVFLFTIALTVFYFSALNSSSNSNEALETLSYEGRTISESILSGGVPEDWSSSRVTQIGILSDGKINDTKLENFYDLASSDYSRTKVLFNTRYDYYFFLGTNMTFNTTIVDGIGKPGINRYNIDSAGVKNLIKVERVSVYKNKIVGATLYVWESD